MEDVLVTVCYINILYMLLYDTVTSLYRQTLSFNLFWCDVSLSWFLNVSFLLKSHDYEHQCTLMTYLYLPTSY